MCILAPFFHDKYRIAPPAGTQVQNVHDTLPSTVDIVMSVSVNSWLKFRPCEAQQSVFITAYSVRAFKWVSGEVKKSETF